eukprot:CAMPEP_0114537708 /NCGR_PEP_ID=MMETSP0109-20121206/29725_1 /TAXON_ID=29199 /ORGANISM="Chlorarachnion reptans, Strain CCCM449" /LENGTH=483 /DNA_ID=CAMNT_0001721621 /DNA_START=40 /DNA_END=1491 /DNA_ORIENTATION=-
MEWRGQCPCNFSGNKSMEFGYGTEYFYGGGIQAAPPGTTQAGTPIKRIPLGVTFIPQDVFHDYLRSVARKYSPSTYNLLSNNCNNFSDAVSSFLLEKKIPEYITGLPQDALSTPMGQMFRPMLENMQNQMAGVVPWGNEPLNLPTINSNPPMALPSEYKGSETPTTSGARIPASNTLQAPSEVKEDSQSMEVLSAHKHANVVLKVVKDCDSAEPFVQNHKPAMYIKFVALIKSYSKKIATKASSAGLTVEEEKTLTEFAKKMGDPKVAVPSAVTTALMKLITKWPIKLLFPVLCIYQACLLRKEECKKLADDNGSYKKIFLRLISIGNVQEKETIQMGVLCVFLNMCASSALAETVASEEKFMEMLVAALESPSDMVRMASSRLAYNAALALPKEGDDGVIMLASILPSLLQEEKKAAITYNNLLALGHLCYNNTDACEVVGAMEVGAMECIDSKFKSSKMYSKLSNVAGDVDILLEATCIEE